MNLVGLRLLKLLGVPTEDGLKIRDATIEIAPDSLTTVVVRYYAELEDANDPVTPINRSFYVKEKQ